MNEPLFKGRMFAPATGQVVVVSKRNSEIVASGKDLVEANKRLPNPAPTPRGRNKQPELSSEYYWLRCSRNMDKYIKDRVSEKGSTPKLSELRGEGFIVVHKNEDWYITKEEYEDYQDAVGDKENAQDKGYIQRKVVKRDHEKNGQNTEGDAVAAAGQNKASVQESAAGAAPEAGNTSVETGGSKENGKGVKGNEVETVTQGQGEEEADNNETDGQEGVEPKRAEVVLLIPGKTAGAAAEQAEQAKPQGLPEDAEPAAENGSKDKGEGSNVEEGMVRVQPEGSRHKYLKGDVKKELVKKLGTVIVSLYDMSLPEEYATKLTQETLSLLDAANNGERERIEPALSVVKESVHDLIYRMMRHDNEIKKEAVDALNEAAEYMDKITEEVDELIRLRAPTPLRATTEVCAAFTEMVAPLLRLVLGAVRGQNEDIHALGDKLVGLLEAAAGEDGKQLSQEFETMRDHVYEFGDSDGNDYGRLVASMQETFEKKLAPAMEEHREEEQDEGAPAAT